MRSGGVGRPLLVLGALLGLVLSPMADAVASRPPRRPAPASRPGWVVDRVRVEGLAGTDALTVGGRGEYRGAIEIVGTGSGLTVVNEVALEDYLRGVDEMPSTWPLEAQRAQAVAARTFVLHQIRQSSKAAGREAGTHICATESCQVYEGLARERRDHAEQWLAAVDSTAGQVLVSDGAPILAQYSSSNGGRSSPGGRPYLRAVDDPDDVRSPLHHWRTSFSHADLTRVFAPPGPVTGAASAGGAVVLAWTAANGDTGEVRVPAGDFRARLNERMPAPPGWPRPVPSARFSIVADEGGVAVLDGWGSGHGIGMSQFGALGKALKGMKAADILSRYYGGLRPTTVPADQLPATVRVALDVDRGSAAVGAPGRFRVLDGAGQPVAVAAIGSWQFVAARGGRIQVVPPGGQDGPPGVEVVAVEPPVPGTGTRVRFRLSEPAVVRVNVADASGHSAATLGGRLLDAGEARVALPVLTRPGAYTAAIAADVGAGRVTTVPVPVSVAPPPAGTELAAGAGTPPAPGAPSFPATATLACVLLAAAASALGRAHRATRAPWPRPHGSGQAIRLH